MCVCVFVSACTCVCVYVCVHLCPQGQKPMKVEEVGVNCRCHCAGVRALGAGGSSLPPSSSPLSGTVNRTPNHLLLFLPKPRRLLGTTGPLNYLHMSRNLPCPSQLVIQSRPEDVHGRRGYTASNSLPLPPSPYPLTGSSQVRYD